jgi:hypothetical protein
VGGKGIECQQENSEETWDRAAGTRTGVPGGGKELRSTEAIMNKSLCRKQAWLGGTPQLRAGK